VPRGTGVLRNFDTKAGTGDLSDWTRGRRLERPGISLRDEASSLVAMNYHVSLKFIGLEAEDI
jgi:hypothetical protein